MTSLSALINLDWTHSDKACLNCPPDNRPGVSAGLSNQPGKEASPKPRVPATRRRQLAYLGVRLWWWVGGCGPFPLVFLQGDFSQASLAPGSEEEAGARTCFQPQGPLAFTSTNTENSRRAVWKDLGMASSGFLSTSIINEWKVPTSTKKREPWIFLESFKSNTAALSFDALMQSLLASSNPIPLPFSPPSPEPQQPPRAAAAIALWWERLSFWGAVEGCSQQPQPAKEDIGPWGRLKIGFTCDPGKCSELRWMASDSR